MAEKSGFFNSINGDRKYLAEDLEWSFRWGIMSGILYNSENTFLVQAAPNTPMGITVQSGIAWFGGYGGYHYSNDSPLTFTLDIGDAVFPRIDRVAIVLDREKRNIYMEVQKGTPTQNPFIFPPNLSREFVLAEIWVAASATSITDTNITDKRLDSKFCGIIKSTSTVYE